MKVDLLRGRVGQHRFHSMLIHFPSALYPFSAVMYTLAYVYDRIEFSTAGFYALIGGVGVSVIAIIYGAIDFLKIESTSKAWKTAGLHALLNSIWFIVFSVLLTYRVKHYEEDPGLTFLILLITTTLGLFVSNYLGAELIVRHKIGIGD